MATTGTPETAGAWSDYSAKTVVTDYLDSFNQGRVSDALAAIHPECRVNAPSALPWGGVSHGLTAFRELLEGMARDFEVEIVSYELWGSGEVAIARIQDRWKSKLTGRSCQMQVVEIYVVKDGKIIDIDVYYQDPDGVAALGGTA